MNFFERQDVARRKTKWLVLYFGLAVALTILAVYLVTVLIFSMQGQHRDFMQAGLWQPMLFLWTACGTLVVVFAASAIKTAQLSGGGGAVATALGGRPVPPDPKDLDERKLRNVVEEMALASGVPVPEIYVLDGEPGINAFAAGHTTSDAAIGVTRGAITMLNRDELQGVIGHEFSHILNGDMRLNLRLIGWIFGIVCIATIGRILMRVRTSSRSDRKGGGGAIILFGLALFIIGSIGAFFGRLIQAAVSRQREFLADASSVQFTRNPEGLAGALKKIGGLVYGSRIEAPSADEVSHMFFGNGVGDPWMPLFATHPPLEQRIRLLDPAFDGSFPSVSRPAAEIKDSYRSASRQPPPIPKPQTNVRPPQLSDLISAGPKVTLPVADAVANVGSPTPHHLDYAVNTLGCIPPQLMSAAREPFGAISIVYALLLSSEEGVRSAQLQQLAGEKAQALGSEAMKLFPAMQQLEESSKVPLVELTLPALRQLSATQYDTFVRNVNTLVAADQQIDLFEFALQKILLRHLAPHFEKVPPPIVQYYSLNALAEPCSVLLSALAYAGQSEPAAIQNAFMAGVVQLGFTDRLRLFELDQCTLQRINSALDSLNQAAPQCKKALIEACAQTISADGVIQPREAELLRAIADSLDSPIPPFVG